MMPGGKMAEPLTGLQWGEEGADGFQGPLGRKREPDACGELQGSWLGAITELFPLKLQSHLSTKLCSVLSL